MALIIGRQPEGFSGANIGLYDHAGGFVDEIPGETLIGSVEIDPGVVQTGVLVIATGKINHLVRAARPFLTAQIKLRCGTYSDGVSNAEQIAIIRADLIVPCLDDEDCGQDWIITFFVKLNWAVTNYACITAITGDSGFLTSNITCEDIELVYI